MAIHRHHHHHEKRDSFNSSTENATRSAVVNAENTTEMGFGVRGRPNISIVLR